MSNEQKSNKEGSKRKSENDEATACVHPSSKGAEKKKADSIVSRRLEGECWEGARKVTGLPPVNGHTGIFGYHMDDCMCSMAGWPCRREGSIWSCCGSTNRDSQCSESNTSKK